MGAFTIVLIALMVIALAAIAVWGFRERSQLPDHLKPYFKNTAELDALMQKQRAAEDKRRAELTDPTTAEEAAEYLSLHGDDVANPTFEKALQMVEASVKDNPSDYAQLLGEIYAFSTTYRNPEKAYYHYYIGLSQDGYSVGFRDENHDPPYYCGPVGDFRNESQVSWLVSELGWEKTGQIDRRAREWLSLNGFKVQEFLEEE